MIQDCELRSHLARHYPKLSMILEKLIVRPGIIQSAFFEEVEAVAVFDGGQAVGDHDDGAVAF